MNIFVLEDDFIQQGRIEKIITGLLDKHEIQPTIFEIFGKPNQLLGAIEGKGAHQLFFLDIEIKAEELKGLEVARKVREIDPYAIIVFVTTHSEFMPLSFRYQVSALDYIDKELSPNDFEKRFETALLYANSKDSKSVAEDSFFFKSKVAQVQVPFNEILYVETSFSPHRVVLHTEKERMEFTASLAEVLEQEKRLLRCHRSFVLNPANVFKLDRKNKVAYFQNGSKCDIARSSIEAVAQAIAKLH